MNDRIEKQLELNAPPVRVWRAITDHEEFGQWFRVKLDGPFVVGETSTGFITYPGHEHMKWEATVQTIEPQTLFSFTWCPYGGDPEKDYSNEPVTLVEFRLAPTSTGTRLVVSESGFAALPDEPRRIEAFRRNSGGWDIQAENIADHVAE
jgi:uncharacterized protein YndB with AHSA1/START domain